MSDQPNQTASTQSSPAPQPNRGGQNGETHPDQHHLVRHHGPRAAALWAASPFALMRQFSRDLDRLFGEALAYDVPTPQIEVLERDGQFVVRADLPGLSKDDVSVELTDDAVVISGERREEHDESRSGLRVSERHYGRFVRSVPLPDGVDGEHGHAAFENGVLEIAIPLPPGRRRGRRIEIQDGGSASPPHG
jgi:HSP20 family molecular chaperone IbpA